MLIRLLVALVVLVVLVGGFAATTGIASASVKGANRAVEREITFDYGDSANHPAAYCRAKRGGKYVCDIHVWDWNGSYNEMFDGKARVTQRGNRYEVDYRIYW